MTELHADDFVIEKRHSVCRSLCVLVKAKRVL